MFRSAIDMSKKGGVLKTIGCLRIHGVTYGDFNFSYIVENIKTNKCTVIDCGDKSVVDYIDDNKLNVVSLMATHKHGDHISGIPFFLKKVDPEVFPVFAPADENISFTTMPLYDRNVVNPLECEDITVNAISVPCHTRGHMLYSFKQTEVPYSVVFTGDCLFKAGCGRFFEGTPEDWYTISHSILPSCLDDDDILFCAHDYTVTNLKCASDIDPTNKMIPVVLEEVLAFKEDKDPASFEFLCTESTYGLEKEINMFLRYTKPEIKKLFEDETPTNVISQLRAYRSNFRAKV